MSKESPPGLFVGLDHPAIAATDVDALADWYCTFFGYRKSVREDKPVWILEAADGTLLEIMPKDDTPRPNRTCWTPGFSHLAVRVSDFAAAESFLEDLGVQWLGETVEAVGGGPLRSFLDPEGNMVQIVQRPA